MKTGELNPAVYNPRKKLMPNDVEYQKIKRSIQEFGYIDPIIVNKNGTIIGGHQRYKVLSELGYLDIDCVMVDLDEEHEKALNIALNKISGEWDMPQLKDLLSELDSGNIDIEITGFGLDEIEKLMLDSAKPEKQEVEFTEELLEEHNFITLYFDNSVDWLQAETFFELQTVKVKNAKEGYEKRGIGRVINGVSAMRKIMGGR
jgi:ParB-like chromosome segregation protein Spo0J